MSNVPTVPPASAQPHDEPVDALAALLMAALRALGDAGEPEAANRLAGHAWSALRRGHPAAAKRINGLMHRLARQQATITTREEQANAHEGH